ncbi:MAG TPA: TolC family protein [Kofleriaceae bacterium]|nr:TolC family protein [Kofleriaceae bacterium]
MQKFDLVILRTPRHAPVAASIAASAALALAAAPAGADTAAPVHALLADPAQLAAWLRDHDPTSRASQAKVEQARELAHQAGVYQNPQLSAGVSDIALGLGNLPPPTPEAPMPMRGPISPLKTSNLSVGISELFEIGKRGPRRAAAELRTREAIESSVENLGGRLSDATVALGKIAYVVAVRDVARQNLEAARQLEANERKRLEHKDLAGIDFARIELDTQELEVELTRADADIAVALTACTATLFAGCNVEGLDVATLDTAAAVPAELADATRAVADRPSHQAQRLEASALGQDAVLADHRKLPDPTIGLTYTYDNYNYSGSLPHSLAVSVGIPLPLLDRGNHDAAAARASARSIELEEDATLRTELGAVEGLRKQFLAVRATLERYERESLPRSQAIVEQARKAFDLGQTGLAELLLDERVHRDLVHKILDTRFELFGVRTQLRRALGLDDVAARSAGGPR